MKSILFLLVLFAYSEAAQDWKLRKNEAGISVYTRKSVSSSLDEFRGIVTIENTSLSKVLDVLLDVENYTSLFPDCKEARIIRKDGMYYDIHYFHLDSPWPVNDRDAVYESITTISADTLTARVEMKPIAGYVDEKKDIVRMKNGSGFWDLGEDGNGNVNIIYEFQPDPGGGVPAWLANSGVVNNPYKTLINLRKIVEENKQK